MEYFLQQSINALAIGSLYALIALGYTMVYGVLRLINFAHGEVFMLGAFTSVYVAGALTPKQPTLLQALLITLAALAASIVVCSLLAFLIERFAYRPLRKASRLSALITAIGVSLLLLNLANITWNRELFEGLLGKVGIKTQLPDFSFFGPTPANYPSPDILSKPIEILQRVLGVSLVWKDVLLLLVTAITLILLWYIVRFTRRGQAMRAVSQNYDAARLMGININTTISFTFILGSAIAAVGATLYCIKNSQVQPSIGTLFGLKAFVAAVIGGIGNIPGAALGGLTLGILETIVASRGYSQYTDAAVFLVLIVMLLVRPEGLFGKAVPEKV